MKFTFPPESRPLAGFTLKRAIYRGGFGEVYYGHSDAGREVALKLLQQNSDVELRGVQQCLNLSHPNLVTIFDVRKDADGDHWVVMEYIAGETLEAVIRRHPQGMPVETVRKWLPGIVAGITFLHSCGLVHRDLKPANIFLENDVVKVGDVGLSKFISPSRHSAQTQSVGTVYYMAPEVAKGRYGKAVDTYALGVILFEMLTGKLPFDGESTGEILMKHLTEQPDLSALPPRLKEVIARALQKDPHDRYDSPDELLSAFDKAILGRSTTNNVRSAFNTETVKAQTAFEEPEFNSAHRTPSSVRPVGRSQPPRPPQSRTSHRLLLLMLAICGLILVPGAIAIDVLDDDLFGPLTFLFLMILVLGVWRSLSRKRSTSRQREMTSSPAIRRTRPTRRPNVIGSRRRLAAALTSTLLATPFAVMLTALLAVLRPSLFAISESQQIDPGTLGFFLSVAVLGSWGAILFPALISFIERPHFHQSTPTVSRWWLAILGIGVGLATWQLDRFLLVDLPTTGDFQAHAIFNCLGEHRLIEAGSGPTLAGYLAFFGTLFSVRNWNKLTSPNRSSRFRIGSVIMTLFVAWLATRVFEFPLPWAMAWSAVIACTVQIASPFHDATTPGFVQLRSQRENWRHWG